MAKTYKHKFFKDTLETVLTPLLSKETNLKFLDYFDVNKLPFMQVLIADDILSYQNDEGSDLIQKKGLCQFYVLFMKRVRYTAEQASALNLEIDKWVDWIENTLYLQTCNYSLAVWNNEQTQQIANINIINIETNLIERIYPDENSNQAGIKLTGQIYYERINY